MNKKFLNSILLIFLSMPLACGELLDSVSNLVINKEINDEINNYENKVVDKYSGMKLSTLLKKVLSGEISEQDSQMSTRLGKLLDDKTPEGNKRLREIMSTVFSTNSDKEVDLIVKLNNQLLGVNNISTLESIPTSENERKPAPIENVQKLKGRLFGGSSTSTKGMSFRGRSFGGSSTMSSLAGEIGERQWTTWKYKEPAGLFSIYNYSDRTYTHGNKGLYDRDKDTKNTKHLHSKTSENVVNYLHAILTNKLKLLQISIDALYIKGSISNVLSWFYSGNYHDVSMLRAELKKYHSGNKDNGFTKARLTDEDINKYEDIINQRNPYIIIQDLLKKTEKFTTLETTKEEVNSILKTINELFLATNLSLNMAYRLLYDSKHVVKDKENYITYHAKRHISYIIDNHSSLRLLLGTTKGTLRKLLKVLPS